MTVKELLKTTTSEVWITTAEDPLMDDAEIKVKSKTDRDEEDFLSKQILESEIYLMFSPCADVIAVSLYWDGKKGNK